MKMKPQLLLRLTQMCLLAGAALPVFAWDVEYDEVAMQVRILVDMTATCWAHKAVDAPLPDAHFDAVCCTEMDRLFVENDPAKQAVFEGIFDETLNPAKPKGVVGLVCEPYGMFSRPGLSYVGRMLTASAGRTLRDHGYAVKGIATRFFMAIVPR